MRQTFENVRYIRDSRMKKGKTTIPSVVLLCELCGKEFEVPRWRWEGQPAASCKSCATKRRKLMISRSMKMAKGS